MAENQLIFPIIGVLAVISATVIVISNREPVRIFMFGVLCTNLSLLSLTYLQPVYSAIRWGAGLTAMVLLWSSFSYRKNPVQVTRKDIPTGIIFRICAVLIVGVSAYAFCASPEFELLGIAKNIAVPGSIILGVGILVLGIAPSGFQFVVGLLMLISSFELVYGSIESAVAVLVLLAVTQIAIAFVFSIVLKRLPGETEDVQI